jgi:hypothetical protein
MRTSLSLVAVCLFIPVAAEAQAGGLLSEYDAPAPAAPAADAYPPPATPSPASAPNPPKLRGFELSFALGYAIPWGNYYQFDNGENAPISDEISGQIPIVIGAGYRINPLISVGAVFQYGYGLVKTDWCPLGWACSGSANDYRLSVEARFHFLTKQTFSPWVSAGLGYEWLSVKLSQLAERVRTDNPEQSSSRTLRGRELLNLEFGGDIRVSRIFTLGPFLGLRFAQYDHISDDRGSENIPSGNKSYHGWVMFGARGAFTL